MVFARQMEVSTNVVFDTKVFPFLDDTVAPEDLYRQQGRRVIGVDYFCEWRD